MKGRLGQQAALLVTAPLVDLLGVPAHLHGQSGYYWTPGPDEDCLSGLFVPGRETDLILYRTDGRQDLSGHIIGHELYHLLCNHTPPLIQAGATPRTARTKASLTAGYLVVPVLVSLMPRSEKPRRSPTC
ncbi:hypothetical protein JOF53_005494 [Crossiella equi]|uniref:IrrE N-terminal-like domain-containing protein n=1 Tax=Crossiella equi TaxID=130796 RepID=A0ABS5AJR8_9PSEU|nr:hypothetical protein [Crossiella equi]MBP2476622.1 hypothetical protein [Crossiella equi]